MDENELTVDPRLTPFERIKLVICSLMELIEEEEVKEKVIKFDNNCLQCYTNDMFLVRFALLFKELYEKTFGNKSLIYLNTKTDDDNYQNTNNFNGKDSFFNPNKNSKKKNNNANIKINQNKTYKGNCTKQIRERNVSAAFNTRKKQTSIINIITDYIEDTSHNECSKDNEENDRNGNVEYIDDDYQEDRKNMKIKSSQLDPITPKNNPTYRTHETDNYTTLVYSARSLLTCNSKSKIRYTRQQKADINMHIGLEVSSKIPKNNLDNNIISQCLFQHKAFLYPTKPIINISLNSIQKYINTFYTSNEEDKIIDYNNYDYCNYEQHQEEDQKVDDISNDSISTSSLLNIIETKYKQKPKQQNLHINKKDNYDIIAKWLSNLCLITNRNTILKKAKSGTLFCDIIIRCESKNDIIKGIIRSPFTQKQEYLNINKALAYLRKINICERLWTADQIQQGNKEIIYSLLYNLYLHYSKSLGRVKSSSHLIRPSLLNKKNDETVTIELNDSMFADMQPNYNQINTNQPLTQLSSLSNILKTAKNHDVSHHTSATTSNICTIANCLGVNTSSLKPRKGRQTIKNKIIKTQQSKDKNIGYKVEKTEKANNRKNTITTNSVKIPQCFIILKKSNNYQMKNQIRKVSLLNHYKINRQLQ